MPKRFLLCFYGTLTFALILGCKSGIKQADPDPISEIGLGWSQNSINTTIFRHNSLTSFENNQVAAYYNEAGEVILASRNLDENSWEIHNTSLKGNVNDAHNGISIMFDGSGILHLAWDHHNNHLHYAHSKSPGSLEMTVIDSMVGLEEQSLSYPEFYRFKNGDLLFVYRDGASGNGNMIMNYYDKTSGNWIRRQNGFISGEGERNAYWQLAIDNHDNIHVSWVWRETWDVATNHDLSYAMSTDRGITWQNTQHETYQLPITANTAENAKSIQQNHELINQTSMTTNDLDLPYITTYWRTDSTIGPQIQVVYFDGKNWKNKQVTNRSSGFTLSGGGTKKIPISRPQILIGQKNDHENIFVIFRDNARDNRPIVAYTRDIENSDWTIQPLVNLDVGDWEPSYDIERWKDDYQLNLFIQKVGQGDGETLDSLPPQMVSVLNYDLLSLVEPN